MRTQQSLKAEWLRFSGFDYTDEDRRLRDRIATLFDIDDPTPEESRLLHMADLRLTLADLPAAAYPNHEDELRALAREYFDQSRNSF